MLPVGLIGVGPVCNSAKVRLPHTGFACMAICSAMTHSSQDMALTGSTVRGMVEYMRHVRTAAVRPAGIYDPFLLFLIFNAVLEQIVIFGTGHLARTVYEHIQDDDRFEVVAFTVDAPDTDNTLFGVPVVDFKEIESRFDPSEYRMLIVMGYSERNQKRKRVFGRAKAKGYALASYIHKTNTIPKSVSIGENCIMLENNTIEQHVSIGDDFGMLAMNLIGHHTNIEDHCFVTSGVVIGGCVGIGSGSTIGMNSTIKHDTQVARNTFVGAHVFIGSDTGENYVYEAPDPKIISTG